MKSFLQLAFVVLTALCVSPSVYAADSTEQDAVNFVKSTAERGLSFLSKPNSTMDEKKDEVRKLLGGSFDMDTIARFSLGRYWNTASASQQKEYTALFRKMVVNVYVQRFGEYKGQKFEVKSARPVGNGDFLVTSVIVPADGGDNIQVDWRVRNKSGANKIVDVLVAGVSMSVTQRADFASVIQQGGGNIDSLLKYLKERT